MFSEAPGCERSSPPKGKSYFFGFIWKNLKINSFTCGGGRGEILLNKEVPVLLGRSCVVSIRVVPNGPMTNFEIVRLTFLRICEAELETDTASSSHRSFLPGQMLTLCCLDSSFCLLVNEAVPDREDRGMDGSDIKYSHFLAL